MGLLADRVPIRLGRLGSRSSWRHCACSARRSPGRGWSRPSDHGDRVEFVGGDFLQSVPEGDLYLIKQILHDWSDQDCVAILKSVRAAIRPGGRIAVIEHVLPERPAMTDAQTMDIDIMVWATGRERKWSEFQPLFAAAGFAFDRIAPNPHGQSVIEAVPV